jgi:iron complex outermembrane receptor protein
MTFNFSGAIGRKPEPPPKSPVAASPGAPPPKVPKPRPTLNITVATTWRLADRISLRPDLPSLDLLDGATLTGTGGRPRWETEIDFRGTVGPASFGLYGRLQGATRVGSELPASDLRFSGRTWLVPYANVDVERVVGQPWARGMSIQFTVENALNDRINVRDRNGATPDRFQAAYIDPLGRSVRLGVRKQF